MDDTSDLTRLTNADPAGPDPDLHAVRARILSEAGSTEADVRVPSRSGRLIAGGIAAAVALLAAGTLAGVALGRATADDPILAIIEDAAEVPAVNTAPKLPSVGVGPGMSSGTGAPAGPLVAAEDAQASSMIWPGYAEGFEPVPDLVDTAGAAPAYRLDSTSIDSNALATRLSAAFDVAGSPESRDGVVTVGADDEPMIRVYDDAMVSWSYSDPTRDPWVCAEREAASGSSEPGPCTPLAPPLSEGAARDQAEAILATLGVDDAPGLEVGLDWETFADGAITTVTAWQTLENARTQLSWSISFDGQGPIWANGFAAGLVSAGELPVVGARTAVLRSAEPRWSAFGPTPIDPMVMPMIEPGAEPSPEIDADTSTSTSPDSPTTELTIEWDPVIVTGAEPTVTQYWSPSGEFWLLPGYQLTTADDRGDWVVIAVAGIAVTFTSQR